MNTDTQTNTETISINNQTNLKEISEFLESFLKLLSTSKEDIEILKKTTTKPIFFNAEDVSSMEIFIDSEQRRRLEIFTIPITPNLRLDEAGELIITVPIFLLSFLNKGKINKCQIKEIILAGNIKNLFISKKDFKEPKIDLEKLKDIVNSINFLEDPEDKIESEEEIN